MPEINPFDDMPVGFYHSILNSIKDPFNIVDRQYRILWANQARARFHQRDLKEMIGQACYKMFQRRTEPCAECPVRIVFDTGKPSVMERSVVLPDGSVKWGDVRCYPIFDRNGEVVRAIQIMIDITKRKTNTTRQQRYIDSLETTIREISGKHVQMLLEYGEKKGETPLTERETEILGLVANGFTNVEIGEVLSISPHTVKSHVTNMFEKLGVKDRTQAAVWAVRHKVF
ncbi:MAG: LuxR C-terminal-related transcriptional regulator [Thermodesulfobacteriota bacterium]